MVVFWQRVGWSALSVLLLGSCVDRMTPYPPTITQTDGEGGERITVYTYERLTPPTPTPPLVVETVGQGCPMYELPPLEALPPLPTLSEVEQANLDALNVVLVDHIAMLRQQHQRLQRSLRQHHAQYQRDCNLLQGR